jgi:hypothetical protein
MLPKPKIEATPPARNALPLMLKPDPNLAKLRTLILDPIAIMFKVDTCLPHRAKERTERVLPKEQNPITDNVWQDPTRAIP